MPKRISRQKRPGDVNQLALHVVGALTGEDRDTLPPTAEQISAVMAEMGRKGGRIGGKRRLQTMTPKERSEAARKAALARWEKED